MAIKIIICSLFLLAYLQSSVCSTEDSILGHMLPLGSHRDPEDVEERHDLPSAKEFFEKYVMPSKAVVFRGIMKDSPMFHTWTDQYILEKYPDFELRLEAKTEKEGYVPVGDVGMGRDTMKNFVKSYHQTNKYVVSELPTPAWDEVLVPPFLTCGPVMQNMVEIDLWMSGGNTSSLLHKDAFNTLNCLINGTKEWKLFEYKYEESLYKSYEAGDPKGGFSRINPEAVDLKKYPKVATVPWSFTTVQKGDCLFLPKSMYHQVKSYGTMNTAVAILFSRFDKVNPKEVHFSDCPSDFLPLSRIDVDWQYPGKGMMFMGYPELKSIRGNLMGIVSGKSEKLYERILQAVTLKDFHPMNATEKTERLLSLLQDGDSKRKITMKYIKQLPRSTLREVAILIEPLIPSNTYDYEFFQISPGEIAHLLSILVKEGNGIVKRDRFVDQYQERLWGSKKFGGLFFDDLAGEGADKLTKEEIVKNFYIAAKKFDKRELTEPDGNENNEEDDDENPEQDDENPDKVENNPDKDDENPEQDDENPEQDEDNPDKDDDNPDKDDENEDDAYIGRNVDLSAEKDGNTLQDLGRQIVEGGFIDSDFNDRARRGKEEDENEDSRKDEADGEEDSATTVKTLKGKAEDADNSMKKDEL